MKQILQSLKTGATEVAEVPCPAVKRGQLLIRSSQTLVSAGTERMLVEFGKAGWIEKRLNALPPAVPFRDGTVLPLLGELLALTKPMNGARRTRRIDGALMVPGEGVEFAGCVRRWLIAEAQREISRRAEDLARRVERPIKRLAIRDPATRWGSCSAAGGLSFSWRLILAPPAVLDYVVAHEIAHLRELNHSARFWSLVAGLAGEHDAERAWLRHNGTRLRRYG